MLWYCHGDCYCYCYGYCYVIYHCYGIGSVMLLLLLLLVLLVIVMLLSLLVCIVAYCNAITPTTTKTTPFSLQTTVLIALAVIRHVVLSLFCAACYGLLAFACFAIVRYCDCCLWFVLLLFVVCCCY